MLPLLATSQTPMVTGLQLPERDKVNLIPFDIPDFLSDKSFGKPKKSIDLGVYLPPAGDQQNQGSCVAFSLSYSLISYIERVLFNYDYNIIDGRPDPSRVFSPAFVFNGVKNMVSNTGCLEGLDFYDAFRFIEKKGVCKWSDYPYAGTPDGCGSVVPGPVFDKAKGFLGYRFYRTGTGLDVLKHYLSTYNPIVVGIYTSRDMAKDGYAHDPDRGPFLWSPQKTDIGPYHAMLCVGFDNKRSSFILLNSWGGDWGNKGYCLIPYDKFYERVREMYVAKPEGRSLAATGIKMQNKSKKMLLPNEYDFRDTRQHTDSLFKADIRLLKSLLDRTHAQDELLRELEEYFLAENDNHHG